MRRLIPALIPILIIACTDEVITGGIAPTSDIAELHSKKFNPFVLLEVSQPDTHEADCYQSQYWYCPPLSAIWRQVVVMDVCTDGVPCLYSDPDCDWSVVSIGECEELFECDPLEYELGVEECTTDDGALGRHTLYCDKGFFEYGPCVPCDPEVCDGIDNDCDGQTDEGEYPCETVCGPGSAVCIDGAIVLCDAPLPEEEICNWLDDDCDGAIDEDQQNACGSCGQTPDEVCDGTDNDCDGDIDENLYQPCSTDCGDGYVQCFGGSWTACSAQQPQNETCNGLDDDCDGLIDENLQCVCTEAGALIPCFDEPVTCGQGYRQCQCIDATCSEMTLTPCYALCYYTPVPGAECDEAIGMPMPEVCNNHDDNCNDVIDEELTRTCYTGPEPTLNVGMCLPGEQICDHGQWGALLSETFVDGLCSGEVTPLPDDLCSDADNDCDGVIEKQIEETDILFIIDGSGSMQEEIDAVVGAMATFAASYSDATKIQWGLIVGPWAGQRLEILQDFTGFPGFIAATQIVQNTYLTGGHEMLYDAIYLAAAKLVPPSKLPIQPSELAWGSAVDESYPPLQQFSVSWRPSAHHVIIVFSDEPGQSYLSPQLLQTDVVSVITEADDLSVYAFSNPAHQHNFPNWMGDSGWEPVCIGGGWYELTTSTAEMFSGLMEILDETACGGSP